MQRLVVRTGTPVKVNAFAAVESACKRANASVGSRRFTFLFVQRRESIQRTNHIVKKKQMASCNPPCGGWGSNFLPDFGMMRGCFCRLRLRVGGGGGHPAKECHVSVRSSSVRPGELSIGKLSFYVAHGLTAADAHALIAFASSRLPSNSSPSKKGGIIVTITIVISHLSILGRKRKLYTDAEYGYTARDMIWPLNTRI